jgi:hypothetical protein
MAVDIAKLGVSIDTSDVQKAKADLQAIVPVADLVERAALKLAKADQTRAKAALEAAKASDTATKEEVKALAATVKTETAKVKQARATLATATAENTAAQAVAAVSRAAQAASGNLDSMGNSASSAATKLARMGTAANDNLNAVQATPANIAAQFQDIGVTAAAGMNPMLIALQQGTQLSVAFSGGLGNIGAALKQVFSPMSILTIAAVALIAYLIQLAMGFFNTSDAATKTSEALSKVSFATDAVGNSQKILGDIFDITTGKLKTQNQALIDMAKAQLMVARVKAQVAAQEAKTTIDAAGKTHTGITGGPGTGEAYSLDFNKSNPETGVMAAMSAGKISSDMALRNLELLQRGGKITAERFAELASAVANYGLETLNVSETNKNLKDLQEGKLSSDLVKPAKPKAASKAKTPAQKFSDIVTGAEGDIAKMEAENSLIGKKGDLYTRAVFEQELLNKANAAHLTLTDAQKTKVAELAESMARLKREGDTKKFYADMDADATKQTATLTMQGKAIGVYGEALYKLQEVQRLRTAAEAAGVTVTDELNSKIDEQASKVAKLTAANDNASFMESVRLQYESATDSLMQQIDALGLYGEAAKKAAIEAKLLAEAKAKNIQLTEAQAAEISQMAASQASYEQQLENLKQINDAVKEIGKSFVTDFIGKVRDGANVWDSLGDAAANALNKITDKLLDMALDSMLGSMGGGKSGGLAALFSAKGNAFAGGAGVAAFANGGAFTNSVVNKTTPFKFGNGGSKLGIMGEAGPEAVMPLTRGADGSLGVQMYGANSSRGGGAMAVNVNVTNNHTLTGAISSEDVVKLNKASADQTMRQIKAQVPQIIQQYRRDGSIAA